MITIRRSEERGHIQFSWLNTYHTFSFGDYYDPKHMHFRSLRVINEDTVAAGMGFEKHPHKDMEILTYVISGAIRHRDSMGNDFTLKAGQIQIMSAGSGIFHSEHNASDIEPLHLYQIWILPREKNLPPRYADVTLNHETDTWTRIVAPAPSEKVAPVANEVTIMQDASVYRAILREGSTLTRELAFDRYGWLQVIKGIVTVGDERLSAGDAASFSESNYIKITATIDAEVLFFDLD